MNLICLIKGHDFKSIAFLYGYPKTVVEVLECKRCGKIELRKK